MQLHYHFEPGNPKDGVTIVVPLALLNQVDARRCEWLVPGLCAEKIQLYLKSLPQKLRRHCVPLPEYSKEFVERVEQAKQFGIGDLLDALILDIRSQTQIIVQRADFRPENLPAHCFMNFRLIDEHGRQLELERNLGQLRAQYAKVAREIFQDVAASAVNEVVAQNQSTSKSVVSLGKSSVKTQLILSVTEEIKDWSFGVLPEMLEIKKGRQSLFGYPALVDKKNHCDIEVFDDPELARRQHRLGLRRLFALSMKDNLKALQKQLPGSRELGLLFMQIGNSEDLISEILDLALERACLFEPLPKDAQTFKERFESGKPKLSLIAQEIGRHVLSSLQAFTDLQKRLAQAKAISSNAYADMLSQSQRLIHAKFVAQTPYEHLVHLPRYLKGILLRIEKLRANPNRDAQCLEEWQSVANPCTKLLSAQRVQGSALDPRLEEFRWQLEELRVALFAQELKTPTPMSVKRLQKILESLKS